MCQETYYLDPPSGRLIVKRDGHSITRQIPKPVVLIDTREKLPFDFGRFPNWIAEEKRQKLKAGDYSVEGMEKLNRKPRAGFPSISHTGTWRRMNLGGYCRMGICKYARSGFKRS